MDANSLNFYKCPAPVTQHLAAQLRWTVLSLCPFVLWAWCLKCSALLSVSYFEFVHCSCKQVPPAPCFCMCCFRNLPASSLFLYLHTCLPLPLFRCSRNKSVSSKLASLPRYTAQIRSAPRTRSNCRTCYGSVTCLALRKWINFTNDICIQLQN